MATVTDVEVANASFPNVRQDLNDILEALATNFSADAEPSTMYANQFWYETDTNLLKFRNEDNDAWITLAYFDQTADEWEVRSAVMQAVDAAGLAFKTDEGTTRLSISDAGQVSFQNYSFPTADGTSGQVLTTDGAGNLSFGAAAGGDSISEGNSSVEVVDTGTGSVRVTVDGSETARFDANGRLGIGTTSPAYSVEIGDGTSSAEYLHLKTTNTGDAGILFGDTDGSARGRVEYNHTSDFLRFRTQSLERARIDSSGNLLVGRTSVGLTGEGVSLRPGLSALFARDDGLVMGLSRNSTDGKIVEFYKDGSAVGSIFTADNATFTVGNPSNATVAFGAADTSLKINDGLNAVYPGNAATGANNDDVIDIGRSSVRFDNIYATNGTIQTSDRNEKQDIEELTESEQRVAVACKSLMRKFRWKSAVEKKDNNSESDETARIHFGIIAQDLQAAFEAEGLDAGRYAMFIYSEWWETYTDVPAVEAVDAVYETVTDEEGNETQVLVSEAVEAKEAYTRTDTYDTEEEAPEGAVKKSRMGVRYSELLAFIIAAI